MINNTILVCISNKLLNQRDKRGQNMKGRSWHTLSKYIVQSYRQLSSVSLLKQINFQESNSGVLLRNDVYWPANNPSPQMILGRKTIPK